jgi:hypothetical protein
MKTLSIILLSTLLFMGCRHTKTTGGNSAAEEPSTAEQSTTPAAVEAAPATVDTTFTFDNCVTGKLPEGWSQGFTGRGTGTKWDVEDDNGNKVLAQLSKNNPSYHFNVIAFNDLSLKNVEVTVRLKGVTGHEDQGGGFVWRFKDFNNYYVVRANPLEDNVVLYKVVEGKRTDLPLVGKGRTYGVKVNPLGNVWNTLKLVVKDDLFTVYLNGKELFQVKDATFTDAGKIGLWTKADAVTYFDDFNVKELK